MATAFCGGMTTPAQVHQTISRSADAFDHAAQVLETLAEGVRWYRHIDGGLEGQRGHVYA